MPLCMQTESRAALATSILLKIEASLGHGPRVTRPEGRSFLDVRFPFLSLSDIEKKPSKGFFGDLDKRISNALFRGADERTAS